MDDPQQTLELVTLGVDTHAELYPVLVAMTPDARLQPVVQEMPAGRP